MTLYLSIKQSHNLLFQDSDFIIMIIDYLFLHLIIHIHKIFKRPVVGVMSTGDELVQGATRLEPGQIRDSNRHSVKALLDEIGVEVIDLGLIPDDEEKIESALLSAVEKCDAIVTSGGVSMGDFDFVKVVLDRLGEMKWMQVAIKPAKPLA